MWNSNCVVFNPWKCGLLARGHSITEQITVGVAIQNVWEVARKILMMQKDMTPSNKTEVVLVQFLPWGQSGGCTHTDWTAVLHYLVFKYPATPRSYSTKSYEKCARDWWMIQGHFERLLAIKSSSKQVLVSVRGYLLQWLRIPAPRRAKQC